jgi:hypothetical protein
MPERAAAPTAKSVEPSGNWFQRMFGSDRFTPEMEEGIRIARKENPNMAPVQPYGPVSRLLAGSALGYVSPASTIYLNPRTSLGQTPQEIADILAHEQTHVNQQSGLSPTQVALNSIFRRPEAYHQRPAEIEAYQAEKQRRQSQGRTGMSPSMDGTWHQTGDVNLPLSGSKYAPTKKLMGSPMFQNASAAKTMK